MKITKFGHSCLLVEEGGVRLIVDPGSYSTGQNELINIDAVLITHEHQDHLNLDSLKLILSANHNALVITNSSVGALLSKENLEFSVIEDGQSLSVKGLLIESFGTTHALIHSSLTPAHNTGYMIGSKLFCPGDGLTIPPKQVEILALPVAGPWIKISESIDYAITVRPKICFAIHDGGIKSPGMINTIMPKILEPLGIKFVSIELDKETEF